MTGEIFIETLGVLAIPGAIAAIVVAKQRQRRARNRFPETFIMPDGDVLAFEGAGLDTVRLPGEFFLEELRDKRDELACDVQFYDDVLRELGVKLPGHPRPFEETLAIARTRRSKVVMDLAAFEAILLSPNPRARLREFMQAKNHAPELRPRDIAERLGWKTEGGTQ
jgi:hypothetical protein